MRGLLCLLILAMPSFAGISRVTEKMRGEILDTLTLRGDEIAIITMTDGGEINIKFFPEEAPNTVKNFIMLSRLGFYDGLTFHRVVREPPFVVQGGCPLGRGTGDAGYNIDAEFNERPHLKGTLAMARSQDPNSASSQFYICLAPQPGLDGQYTVFGQVIKGMDVVEKIEIGDVMESVRIETKSHELKAPLEASCTLFKADTLYDTTWVKGPIYETGCETSYISREITETEYEESLVLLKDTTVLLGRGLLTPDRQEIAFWLPHNSTGKVTIALAAVKEEFQKDMEEVLKGAGGVVALLKPTVGLLTSGAATLLEEIKTDFNYYLMDGENLQRYRRGLRFYHYGKGEGVTNVRRERVFSPGKWYYLCLKNPCVLLRKVIYVEISTFIRTDKCRYSVRDEKFVPPEDGRITEEMMNRYIKASRYLLEAIRDHEKFIEAFVQRYGLSDDLSELTNSAFREANRDVIEAWDQIVKRWNRMEKDAYKKAGIREDAVNWIGGALTDPLNKEIQEKTAEELKAMESPYRCQE